MTIQILKPMPIHETMILWLFISPSASTDSLANHLIHFSPTFAGQTHKHFCISGCVADFVWSEGLEFFLCQQHYINVAGHNHAGGTIACELRIEGKAELSKELYGVSDIPYGQIDKNFSGQALFP